MKSQPYSRTTRPRPHVIPRGRWLLAKQELVELVAGKRTEAGALASRALDAMNQAAGQDRAKSLRLSSEADGIEEALRALTVAFQPLREGQNPDPYFY